MFFRDKRERLDKVAAISVVLKRNRSEETGVNGGDDDAAGVVGERAVGGAVGAVEGTGDGERAGIGGSYYELLDFYLFGCYKRDYLLGGGFEKAWGEPASPRG